MILDRNWPRGDPCQHARNTTDIGDRSDSRRTSSGRRSGHSLGSLMPRTATESGRIETCSPARHGDGHRGMSQDGSSVRRQEGPKETPRRGNAGNVFTTTRDGEGTQNTLEDTAPGTGGPAFSRGEALLSLSSWPTNGVCRKIGRRGSLVG